MVVLGVLTGFALLCLVVAQYSISQAIFRKMTALERKLSEGLNKTGDNSTYGKENGGNPK